MTFIQTDGRWDSLILGLGDTTFGWGACLLCDLCDAARRLGTWPDVIPPHANNALKRAPGAFLGSNLVVDKAAPVLGLSSPQSELVVGAAGDPALAKAAAAMLDAGDLLLLHVDFDRRDPPEHFILGTERLPDGRILCSDPAIDTAVLTPDTLEGLQTGNLPGPRKGWPGGPRIYRVRGVRPLRAIPGAVIKDFDVEQGDTGERVSDVQAQLNTWLTREGRPTIPVDGDFGAVTKVAVELFQEAQGLAVDGVVGPLTSRALLNPR